MAPGGPARDLSGRRRLFPTSGRIVPVRLSAIERNRVDIAAAAAAKRPKRVSASSPRCDQIHYNTATAAPRRKLVVRLLREWRPTHRALLVWHL
jgi:hypothetical protein